MCWLVQMLKILYLFFIRASVVRLSLIPEVSEGLELLLLGRRSHLQLYNSPSIIWAEMGEGEDERPPNFDEILEMTGLDPDQVSTSNIWELSILFIYLPRSSVLHSLGFIRTLWMSEWLILLVGLVKCQIQWKWDNTSVQAECHQEWNKLNYYCIVLDCH